MITPYEKVRIETDSYERVARLIDYRARIAKQSGDLVKAAWLTELADEMRKITDYSVPAGGFIGS